MKILITNGKLGSDNTSIVEYKVPHPNSMRAMYRVIGQFMDRVDCDDVLVVWHHDTIYTAPHRQARVKRIAKGAYKIYDGILA